MTLPHPRILLIALVAPVVSAAAVVQLAGTIRDFNTGKRSNAADSSFNRGAGGNCSGPGHVQPILGPNRKPVPTLLADNCNEGDSARLANYWFTTDSTYTYSATTCINLPMTLDSTGYSTYDNQSFFPLDNFTTLPNGKTNPFNFKQADCDKKQHNFGFCMEMHGTFDYSPGQFFDFRGDDDVWFFINNRLVVDLGGIHAAEAGAVNLDTLGLATGAEYNWDFFYCERNTCASDIRIHTSMNLRTSSRFSVEDSTLGPGRHVYSIWLDQSNTSACSELHSHAAAAGQFTITGAGLANTVTLPAGSSYGGGIVVSAGMETVLLDTASLVGLAPGTYTLHILPLGSTTGGRDVVFTVPQPPLLRLRFVGAGNVYKDTLGLVELLGAQTPVQVGVFQNDTLCTRCKGILSLTPSSAGLGLVNAQGRSVTSLTLANGTATVLVKGAAPVSGGSLVFRLDSAGISLVAQPIHVLAPAPDSAVYLDDDGDGSLDHVRIHLKTPWTRTQSFQLPWPSSDHLVNLAAAGLAVSRDSLTVDFTFPGVSPDTTAARSTLAASWKWDSTAAPQGFPVVERIAAVPLHARLVRGNLRDTLRIPPSEGVVPVISDLASLAGRTDPGGALRNTLRPVAAWVESSTGSLVLIFPADSIDAQVRPGDSVRFLSGILDASGNAPGTRAKRVVVEGGDALPVDAAMYDADADGRADRAVLRLRTRLVVTDSVQFAWPDTLGALQYRTVAVAGARSDSGGLRLTFSLEPFQFGSTSCPVGGCAGLGALVSRFAGTAPARFPVRDAVVPVPKLAFYHWSDGSVPDTLEVVLSEPVRAAEEGPWVALGRPSADSLGRNLTPLSAPWRAVDGLRAKFLVDSSVFSWGDGDSLRIASSTARGVLADTVRNAPGRFAHWTPLVFGAPPLQFRMSIPHPVVRGVTTDPPAAEPAITLLSAPPAVRGSSRPAWKPTEGPLPEGLDSRFSGAVLDLNRVPETMGFYIYDNLGVLVLSRQFSDLATLDAQGALPRDERGNYRLWFAWDGKDGTGRPAASGIYTARIFGWLREGDKIWLLNDLRTLGFQRKLK